MNKKSADIKKLVLNRLVLDPNLKAAAEVAQIHPITIYRWIKESIADPEKHQLTWLSHKAPFFQHVNAARKLNVVALDHKARSLAIEGHVSKKFHDGKPVWKIDPKKAADAKSMDLDTFRLIYGESADPADCYTRDDKGALVQEVDVSPPNPAILVKLLTSLAPQIYGEKSEVTHTHQGHVWIDGAQPAPMLSPPAPGHDFNESFGLTQRPEQAQRPTNTLAIPRPCKDSAEFDAKFRRKLLREVVLFRDTEGKLLQPFPDDVVVAGTAQARAFEDAGIEVKLVHPTTLLDEGFENEWLKELAPNHKRKPRPPAPEDVGQIMGARMRETSNARAAGAEPVRPVEPPGKASARYDSENIGRGAPKSGGYKVML